MTRETKVGMVVACSFLCLVGIVVASKINGGADTTDTKPAGPTTGQEHSEMPAKPPELNQVAAAKSEPQRPEPPTTIEHAPKNVKDGIPSSTPVNDVPPPLSTPPVKGVGGQKADDEFKKRLAEAKNRNTEPGAPVAPIPTVPNLPYAASSGDAPPKVPLVLDEPNAKPQQLAQLPPVALNPLGQPKVGESAPPLPPVNKDLPPPVPFLAKEGPPPVPAQPKDGPPAVAGVPQVDLPTPTVPPIAGGLPVPDVSKPPQPIMPPKDSFPSGSAVIPNPNAGAQASPPLVPPFMPETKSKEDFKAPQIPPMSPPNSGSLPVGPPPGVQFPMPNAPSTNRDFPNPGPAAFPPATVPQIRDVDPMTPRPTIGPESLPRTPPIALPFNAAPSPPPGILASPQVRVTNPDTVKAREGETFAQLSKRCYNDEKYATALAAYNRDHYQAVVNGTVLRTNPAQLPKDLELLRPPVNLLESEYSQYIPRAAANPTLPTIGTANPVVPVMGTTPAQRPAQPLPPNAPVTTDANGNRIYTVQAGGESILDIARNTLGDVSRWTDIYQRNQSQNIQPQFLIPAGTRLILP